MHTQNFVEAKLQVLWQRSRCFSRQILSKKSPVLCFKIQIENGHDKSVTHPEDLVSTTTGSRNEFGAHTHTHTHKPYSSVGTRVLTDWIRKAANKNSKPSIQGFKETRSEHEMALHTFTSTENERKSGKGNSNTHTHNTYAHTQPHARACVPAQAWRAWCNLWMARVETHVQTKDIKNILVPLKTPKR